jgi:hypothetical protein
MQFVKLFNSIIHSSISEEDLAVRWMWIVLLVSCDRNGEIRATRKALARSANMSEKEADTAINILLKPDPDSSSTDFEGARLLEMGQNHWCCVNYLKYRKQQDPEQERIAARDRKRRQREREKESHGSHENVTDVTECHAIVEEMRGDEIENRGDEDTSHAHPVEPDERFEEFWTLYPRKIAKKKAHTTWNNMTITNREKALAALPLHINHYWQGKDTKFIPHPTTWLNQERWADEILVSDGCDPEADQWIYDTYRVEDRDAHCRDEMWEKYIEVAAGYPPREAPTFDEWTAQPGRVEL